MKCTKQDVEGKRATLFWCPFLWGLQRTLGNHWQPLLVCISSQQNVSTCLLDWDFISLPKMQKKKKKLGQYPAILTSAWSIMHMNIFHADSYKSGKERQYKKCTSEPRICRTWRSVDFLFLVIRFMKCWLQHWSHNYIIKIFCRVWANKIKRAIDQHSHCFCVCQFDAKSTSV